MNPCELSFHPSRRWQTPRGLSRCLASSPAETRTMSGRWGSCTLQRGRPKHRAACTVRRAATSAFRRAPACARIKKKKKGGGGGCHFISVWRHEFSWKSKQPLAAEAAAFVASRKSVWCSFTRPARGAASLCTSAARDREDEITSSCFYDACTGIPKHLPPQVMPTSKSEWDDACLCYGLGGRWGRSRVWRAAKLFGANCRASVEGVRMRQWSLPLSSFTLTGKGEFKNRV